MINFEKHTTDGYHYYSIPQDNFLMFIVIGKNYMKFMIPRTGGTYYYTYFN